MRVFLSKPRVKVALVVTLFGLLGVISFQNCAPQRLESDFDTMVNGVSQNQTRSTSSVTGLVSTSAFDPRNIGAIPGIVNPTPPPVTNPSVPVYGSGGPSVNPQPSPGGGTAPTSLGCALPADAFTQGHTASATDLQAATVVSGDVTYLRSNNVLNTWGDSGTKRESCKDYFDRVTRADFDIGEGSLKAGADRIFNGRYGVRYRCLATGLSIEKTEEVVSTTKSCETTYCTVTNPTTGRVSNYFPGDRFRNITRRPNPEEDRCISSERQPFFYFQTVNYVCTLNGATASWVDLGLETISNNIIHENAQEILGANYSQTVNPLPTDRLSDFITKNTSSMISAFFRNCPFTTATSVINDSAKDVKYGLINGGYRVVGSSSADRFFVKQLKSGLFDYLSMYSAGSTNLTMVRIEEGVYSGTGIAKPVGCTKYIPFEATFIRQSGVNRFDYTYRWLHTACGVVAGAATTAPFELDLNYSNISTTLPPPPPAPAPVPAPAPAPNPGGGGDGGGGGY